MKICVCVEQYTHALLECPEGVNKITKNHTKAVSGELCMISLSLQNLILRVTDVLIADV